MGRRRGFDEVMLLRHATDQFWQNGFEATSISDIAGAAGLGHGSLYAAYGSKFGLFLTVFEEYCAGRVDVVRRVMEEAPDGTALDAVDRFLDVIIADCVSHRPGWGCLMLNSIAELGRSHPQVTAIGSRSIAQMEALVASRLDIGAERGELVVDEGTVPVLAAHIVMISQGIIQRSLTEPSRHRLEEIARSASAALPLGRAA